MGHDALNPQFELGSGAGSRPPTAQVQHSMRKLHTLQRFSEKLLCIEPPTYRSIAVIQISSSNQKRSCREQHHKLKKTNKKIAKMPSFDQKKAYAEQEEVFFDDGREVELLHYVFGLPELESIRGNPAKVLQAIDKFGREKKYLMNVGEDKGKIVTDLIAEVKPQTMVQYLIKTPSHQRLINHYLLQ